MPLPNFAELIEELTQRERKKRERKPDTPIPGRPATIFVTLGPSTVVKGQKEPGSPVG